MSRHRPGVLALGTVITALVGLTAAATWRRRWLVVRVEGSSMTPSLPEGSTILARRMPRGLSIGDVVVFAAPKTRSSGGLAPGRPDGTEWLLIKRVAASGGDVLPDWFDQPGSERVPRDKLLVLGDNGGLDSRTFGYIALSSVKAVHVRRLRVGNRAPAYEAIQVGDDYDSGLGDLH